MFAGDGLAGVAGGNGGGGSFKAVTVIGGKYGIDSRRTGDAPTWVAVTLINQTCAGVLHGSQSTLIATGLVVRGAPAIAAVVAGIDVNVFGIAECVTPNAPGLGHADGRPQDALVSAASIVDSAVQSSASPCFIANSSLFLSDVFVSGCSDAILSGGRPPLKARGSSSHIGIAALGRLGSEGDAATYEYAFPAYVDGKRSVMGESSIEASNGVPLDIQTKHWSGTDVTWQVCI